MTKKNMPVYLDYQATTPCDPRVIDAMIPYFYENFGNAHSKNHIWGWEAEEAVEKARTSVASLIGANSKDIIFTSGATEANNLALKGVMEFYKQKGKNHLIVTKIEHKCVLASASYLEEQGYEVTYLPVQTNGIVDIQAIKDAIKPNTALVSVMMVNNEVGTIQPVKEIGALCRENKVFFHTDAAQAAGKIPVNVDELNVDLMSLSAHKMYGPKGIGALYVRRKPRVRVLAQIHGGGQERGLRSGTLPVPLCVGFGVAADIAIAEMEKDTQRITAMVSKLKNELTTSLKRVYVNGDPVKRVYNNLNISFAGVEGESLLMGFSKYIAVSSGSACTSSSLETSYVLKAMGVEDDLAHTSIRFGLGRFTTEEEIENTAKHIIKAVTHLRSISPIWDMLEQGVDLSQIQWSDH